MVSPEKEKKLTLSILMLILLSASIGIASGWNDFTLDIGDSYNIVRCNSMDVCIGKADMSLILYPDKYDDVGPVACYFTTPKFIFTKNVGKKRRNLFQGDTFQDIDSSKEFFFIISKGTDEIIGPLSASQFNGRPEVATVSSLNWSIPRNPNITLSLFGSLIFLVTAIPVLAIKFFWITIPVIAGSAILIKYIRSKKKQNAPN